MGIIKSILSILRFDSFGSDFNLSVGDVWSYETRPEEQSSTLTILKIEELQRVRIVHIRIDGLKMKGPNGLIDSIEHLPFDEAALKKYLHSKVSSSKSLPDFSEGYQQWKDEEGGVFTISVREAVGILEQAFQ